MKIIKSISIFFKDLKNLKRNIQHKNSESSYQIMRLLYRISDGLLLHVISKYFNNNIRIPSFLKKSFFENKNLNRSEVSQLYNEIIKMRLSNNTIKDEKLKMNDKMQIDFDYYKNKNLMRLDINREDLFKNKVICEYALKENWINVLKEILGCKPQLLGIDSWITLSPPNIFNDYDDAGKIVSSQMWHRDCDNLRDLKVMTYLTDVMNDNEGPFEIIEDTHKFNFFNPFAYVMGSGLRIKNDYVIKKFNHKIKSFLGKAGSSFVVDTRAIHRVKTINQKNFYRLIIQLYYSNSTFGKNKDNPKLNKDWPSYYLWKNALETKSNYIKLFI